MRGVSGCGYHPVGDTGDSTLSSCLESCRRRGRCADRTIDIEDVSTCRGHLADRPRPSKSTSPDHGVYSPGPPTFNRVDFPDPVWTDDGPRAGPVATLRLKSSMSGEWVGAIAECGRFRKLDLTVESEGRPFTVATRPRTLWLRSPRMSRPSRAAVDIVDTLQVRLQHGKGVPRTPRNWADGASRSSPPRT